MRRLLALALLLVASASHAANKPAPLPPQTLAEIDATIEQAIKDHRIPGGVFHLEHDGVVYEKAYGNRALVPAVEAMTADTIFDMASITKVMATTPAIWLLIQQGRLSLDDKVSKFIPEYKGGWRDEMTIRHLLTHTSGLRPDLDLSEAWTTYDTAIILAIAEEPRNRPGTMFRYSDINFELLGEIVRRLAGPLDEFVENRIYGPLGMKETFYLPILRASRPGVPARVAPTQYTETGVMLRGIVHDPTARRMGAVAGHAGLFSTAHDVAIYARMLLRGGAPLFTPETVRMMTTVQSPPAVADRRTGGFDYDTGFSRPRGDLFPIGSYGHTGFTGTILWIDPASKTFYIFLSNRVHPDGKGSVTSLQKALGTLAAKAVGYTTPVPRRVDWIIGGDDAINGVDALVAHQYDVLRGHKVGLITNHSGIDRSGNPTADLLRGAPGVELKAYFSPEHGFRGALDENVDDSVDTVTGLPIYSLYGKTRKPLPEQLKGIDTLVFDIQDVGVRFYTYIATMQLAMEACAENHVRFVVLDRVNPIGGVAVEGPLLRGEQSFIAPYPIPVRHGMTVGELAQMIKDERHLDLNLEVVKAEHWKRGEWQDEAGLPWVSPSPNMRSLDEAALYPGLGLFDQANVSVGRGTPIPFEHVGAPWIKGMREAAKLVAALPPLPGVKVEATRFTPASSKFAGKECFGVHFIITDRKAARPLSTGLALIKAMHELWPAELPLEAAGKLLLDPGAIDALGQGRSLSEIEDTWKADDDTFRTRRSRYLLYSE
jgi:uncharacterized protein YbbC (DUF1343 family)/CubicO group peptidase (beta-lactamase class C family)